MTRTVVAPEALDGTPLPVGKQAFDFTLISEQLDSYKNSLRLPNDILILICMFLDVEDVISLSQASRLFRDLTTNSYTVWYNLAFRYQCRSRILVLDDLTGPKDLNCEELRQVVLRTHRIESNWARPIPTPIEPTSVITLNCHVTNFYAYSWFYISEEYFSMPTVDDRILIYDRLRNNVLESYELREWNGLFIVRMDHKTRTIVALVGEWVPMKVGTTSTKLIKVITIKLPEKAVLPKDELPSKEPNPLRVDQIAALQIPRNYHIQSVIEYAKNKLLCVLYRVRGQDSVKLLVLPNWDEDFAVVCHTGSIYSARETAYKLDLSADGDWIYLHVVCRGIWSFLHFSVPEISKKKQKLWHVLFDEDRDEAVATRETTFDCGDAWEALGIADVPLIDYWNLSAWWQRLPNVPRAYCRVFLFCQDGIWTIAQQYTTLDRILSIKPFLVTLRDPLLINDIDEEKPMVGVCFNHLVWIELDEDGTNDGHGGPRRKKRVLRLVCFPEHDMEIPWLSARDDSRFFKTLEVDSEILDEAHNLFIEQSLGSIIVTTRANKLYTIKYA